MCSAGSEKRRQFYQVLLFFSQVFQRRQDGSVDFDRDWESYRLGFGNISGEFWLGNDNLHRLTAKGETELRIDITDYDGKETYIVHESFSVASESSLYKLWVGDETGTTAGKKTSNSFPPCTQHQTCYRSFLQMFR